MRRLLGSTLLAVCLTFPFGGGALGQSYNGDYAGTYTASQLPGQTLKIGLYFHQLNMHQMIANYTTSSGVSGLCYGPVKGNVALLTCTNSTENCSGTYHGRFTFSGTTVTWTYTGKDCLGREVGKSIANKVTID